MNKKRLCFLAAVSVLLGFTFSVSAAPTEVACPRLAVEVTLDESGTAAVLEHWTLILPETVSTFSRTVTVSEGQTLSGWELSEKKGAGLELPYTPITEKPAEAVASTLLLTAQDRATTAEWTFTPGEETREFTLGYSLKNAVQRHADVADYTAAFSDADNPFVLETVTVQINFPVPTTDMLPQAYLHGTLQNSVAFPQAGQLLLTGSSIPANTALDVRALLPTSSFPQQVADEETHKESLMAEEAEKQQQAETAPKLTWIFWGIVGGLALVVVLAGLLIRLRTVRKCARFAADADFDPSFTPPQVLPPAVLPDFYYFYSAKAADLRGKRVVATLLDLFSRGIIAITVNKDESLLARDTVVFTKLSDLPADASEYETVLMTLLFDTVSGGNARCTMADLARYGRQNEATVGEALSAFDRASRRAFNACGFADKSLTRKKRAALIGAMLANILAVVAAVLGFVFDLRLLVLVPAFFICGILAGSCLSLRRLTADAESAFLHWHTYRHFLKDFSEADTLPPTALWEPTLINAAALGVLDRVLPQLYERMGELNLKEAFPKFYPLFDEERFAAVLAIGVAFDAYPHARLHSYHEE